MKLLSLISTCFRRAWQIVTRPFRRKKADSPNIYPLF